MKEKAQMNGMVKVATEHNHDDDDDEVVGSPFNR